jgi:hypothetical protein
MSEPSWQETAERLFPKILKRDGILKSELSHAEKRLGFSLPAPLHAMYRLAGKRADLHSTHDRLLPPNKLIVVSGALVFYEAHDQSAAWGIQKVDLFKEDPPVVRALNQPPYAWQSDHDSVSAFFFTQLLWQSVHADPCVRGRATESALAEVRQRFPEVRLAGCHWDITAAFLGDKAVLLVRGDTLYVGAASADDLSHATKGLAVEWS